jgi:glycine/D-amino acid oxidase-like deaminating enzyme
MTPDRDIVVVGGGFYGIYFALKLARLGHNVLILEAGSQLMQRASRNNQARVHQGYHYPRSTLTALRSRENYQRFTEEFSSSVSTQVDAYYSIAAQNSKINADQFYRFMQRIGAPIRPASSSISDLFDSRMIAATFEVREAVFDSDKLRMHLEAELKAAGVLVSLNTRALRLRRDGSIETTQGKMSARQVLLCTYAFINEVLALSDLPTLDLRYELAEMVLVEPPPSLRGKAFTVMCGPFFSLLPYPPANCYTLSHVRYTPHGTWTGSASLGEDPVRTVGKSHASRMIQDARRYLPAIDDCVIRGSLYEIKALLPKNNQDDGRPILVKAVEGCPHVLMVMGGKIDNVYDAWETLKPHFDAE